MANDSVPVAPSTATAVKQTLEKAANPAHPLDPLTPDEILAVSLAVRHYIAEKTPIKAVRFIANYLVPPPKRAVLAHLGIPLLTGEKVREEDKVPIVRKAEVDFLDVVAGDAYNAIVALDSSTGNWAVETLDKLPEGTQPQLSPGELLACEEIIKADEGVRKLAKEVGFEPEQLFADGWSIGYDDRFPAKLRIQQALMFARLSKDDNLYGHPLDFVPVVDMTSGKVIHIDFPGRYTSADPASLSVPTTKPPALTGSDSVEAANRSRIPVPMAPQEFLPEVLKEFAEKEGKQWKEREDIKPLHVIQPEGVSFKMDGHVLEWQKWKMHISFTQREGIALSTITYNDDGVERPIFYRLSLAEMVVPYGAPEHPSPRKFAFDSGEYGMGTMANELSLGCDCLGQIHYLPGAYVGHDGSAVIIKNVICIHEEDDGLLWKHTDYRTGGRAYSVRSRRLVVSMVCTLANYEYIWNYRFYQDGSIELEVRLTGILQVVPVGENDPTPFGVKVAPGINAQHHQHLFSVRLDPMIDGLSNSVVETDVVPVPFSTGSDRNFAGNGFVTQDKVIKLASEGARDYDLVADRRWRIVNFARKHYSTGQPVGYALAVKGGITSFHAREDGWDDEQVGAKGGRMWPAGKYVPQARGEPADSVGRWLKEDSEKGVKVENEDLVVFLTVGLTHIARPEDWPVMPVDHLRIMFRPNSFFVANPSLDVPGRKDPKSVPAFAGSEGASCCAPSSN
ncbi:hypothetical protein EW146_g7798 [Bondarzewia mesenterica]|uniref:Amine oxidase n=1 Tax=Bondarzewia mesenterica TaxID=1095465 RepID=A0A4S4LK07_9AGAM|nr:hypothetical protein EW146_g7798 [Bondarzewia mesenterica]